LTPREIEILTLLTRQLSDKEIASQLVISVNTVRFHLKNIYAKLSVSNRRQAALRAQELGLVSTPGA
jgi:ATP/maltotriose-dependent transcriptional regulator MalT